MLCPSQLLRAAIQCWQNFNNCSSSPRERRNNKQQHSHSAACAWLYNFSGSSAAAAFNCSYTLLGAVFVLLRFCLSPFAPLVCLSPIAFLRFSRLCGGMYLYARDCSSAWLPVSPFNTYSISQSEIQSGSQPLNNGLSMNSCFKAVRPLVYFNDAATKPYAPSPTFNAVIRSFGRSSPIAHRRLATLHWLRHLVNGVLVRFGAVSCLAVSGSNCAVWLSAVIQLQSQIATPRLLTSICNLWFGFLLRFAVTIEYLWFHWSPTRWWENYVNSSALMNISIYMNMFVCALENVAIVQCFWPLTLHCR